MSLYDKNIIKLKSDVFNIYNKKPFTIETHDDIIKEYKTNAICIAYSSDNKYIAYGSKDKTINILNINGEYIKTLIGHKYEIYCIAYSPNGKYIISISGSIDKTIRIWDTHNYECIQNYNISDYIKCISFSMDSKYIAYGSKCKIGIIDINTGRIITKRDCHTSTINCIAFSPDNNYIVSGSNDKSICITNITNNTYKKIICKTNVMCVVYSPCGTKIVYSLLDNIIHNYHIKDRHIFAMHTNHTEYITCLAYSSNGEYIVSGSNNKTICISNTNTYECIKTNNNHINNCSHIAISPDCKHIIFGSYDKSIYIWDVSDLILIKDNIETLDFNINKYKLYTIKKQIINTLDVNIIIDFCEKNIEPLIIKDLFNNNEQFKHLQNKIFLIIKSTLMGNFILNKHEIINYLNYTVSNLYSKCETCDSFEYKFNKKLSNIIQTLVFDKFSFEFNQHMNIYKVDFIE